MRREELVITTAELHERLGEEDLVVVDVRWGLDDEEAGARAYQEAHVPGAVYLHWYRDWSDPDDPVQGQLAPPERFAQAMGRAGIGDETLVVAYDDNQIFMAPRLAWALRHYGHEAVLVLDGGWPKWQAEGRPAASVPAQPVPARFTVRAGGDSRLTKEQMLELVEHGGTAILDCRMDATWETTSGHIPGARRFPAPHLVDEMRGTLRPPGEIAALARSVGLSPVEPVALYCGGGVSASAAYLALRSAGFTDLKVYDGSWSEWEADPETPKATH